VGGVKSLVVGGLAANDQLAVLNLTSCQIGGLGAAIIAQALIPKGGGGGGLEAAVAGDLSGVALRAGGGGCTEDKQVIHLVLFRLMSHGRRDCLVKLDSYNA
jgi:hypothetical protein